MSRRVTNFQIALGAISGNKVRSLLTALGIIFGVAAVIAMLAIGNGAKQEILEQIKLVGVNNIIVKPLVEQKEEEVKQGQKGEKPEQKKFTPGLNNLDLLSIQQVLPCVEKISPEIEIETNFIRNGWSRSGKLIGVGVDYFAISNFVIDKGANFNQKQNEYGDQVCIIGKGIATRFFYGEDPVGKFLKCGPQWLKVIGVLQERKISKASISNLGIRDFNMDVYTPVKTILIRYKNRSLITKAILQRAAAEQENDDGSGSAPEKKEVHQLDKIIVQVKNTEDLVAASEVISRLMKRRHYQVVDYEISVPELLLKQQQKTKDIFNFVLGAIAGISLIVGGIGIMNIMLASVLERIKEIGLRLSIGATKNDVVQQFLFESVLISLSGGILGIILGVTLTAVVEKVSGIQTIISGWSIFLSFGVSVVVGLIFGIAPARRAAEQDPITSLRYE